MSNYTVLERDVVSYSSQEYIVSSCIAKNNVYVKIANMLLAACRTDITWRRRDDATIGQWKVTRIFVRQKNVHANDLHEH